MYNKPIDLNSLREYFHNNDFSTMPVKDPSEYSEEELKLYKKVLKLVNSEWKTISKSLGLTHPQDCYSKDYLPELLRERVQRIIAMLSTKYQEEQSQLENKMRELQAKLDKSAQDTDGAEKWLSLIRKYTKLTELTAPLLNELIDKIVIHQAETDENGSRTQEIEIFYRFVGKID